MSEAQALLSVQLLETAVIDLSFSLDSEKQAGETADGNFTLGTQFATDLDGEEILTCSCLFDLDFSLAAADDPTAAFLIIKCKYEATIGILREVVSVDLPSEELEELLQTSAFSSGYACMRSFIDGIARHSKLGKFYLPSFNANEYMRLVFEKQKEGKG